MHRPLYYYIMRIQLQPDHESAAYLAALAAIKALHSHGYDGYFIGGSVRDLLLGRIPKDFDIVTNATPEQIQTIPEFSRTFFKDPAQAYGVSRVHMPEWPDSEIEIATYRRDINPHLGRKDTSVEFADSQADAQRRDFTINAMAYDPVTHQLVDHVGGQADLQYKQIRFIGSAQERTTEDPLRILRAIRFKNSLDFQYAESTIEAIRQAVEQGLVEKIAIDRLRQEFSLMLIHPSRKQAVADLDWFEILDRVLPEVTRGKGVEQPPEIHAEGDVFTHTLLAIDALPAKTSERLAWATLLHDIGKPPTQTLPSSHGDRVRFSRHYAVGAEMAQGLLRRLNFSNKMTKDICWMIEHHINIDDVPKMRAGHQRAMLEHPAFGDLIELHKADAAAAWPKGGGHKTPPQFPEIETLWHHYKTVASKQPKPSLKHDLGIDGHWLHQNFPQTAGVDSGTIIAPVLEGLKHAYENEGITDGAKLKIKAAELIYSLESNLPEHKNDAPPSRKLL